MSYPHNEQVHYAREEAFLRFCERRDIPPTDENYEQWEEWRAEEAEEARIERALERRYEGWY